MQEESYNRSLRIGELIKQYVNGELDKNGEQELTAWRTEDKANEQLFETLTDRERREQSIAERQSVDWTVAYQRVQQTIVKGKKRRRSLVLISAAAMAAFIVGAVWFFQAGEPPHQVHQDVVLHDILPGGNKAILTLGDGRQIALDSNADGVLARQGNTQVVNLRAGQLAYKSGKDKVEINERVQYNTITTPKGGQYEIVLPDGSKVWLNAASSLKFPTAFKGNKRAVTMTGEAYFEINPLHTSPGDGAAAIPFIVYAQSPAGKVVIKVLGTHFNVMAYENEESIKTTLVEGAVRVSEGEKDLLLNKTGQEARVRQNGAMTLAKDVNVAQVVAWKNHLFWFAKSDVEKIMDQLARWYDVNIEIKGPIQDSFTGIIPRNITLAKVFEVLQQTGSIHYKIEDNRTVVVTP